MGHEWCRVQVPHLGFILNRAQSADMAIQSTRQLVAGMLPAAIRHEELAGLFEALDDALKERTALTAEAAGVANATSATIVTRLLAAKAEGISHATPDAAPSNHPSVADAIEAAFLTPDFLALERFLAGIDTDNQAHRKDAVSEAFSGKVMAATRIMLSQSPAGDPLRRRRASLDKLNDVRSARAKHINFVLRFDHYLGLVPERLLDYCFADETSATPTGLLAQFYSLDWREMDFVKATRVNQKWCGGMLAYEYYFHGKHEPQVADPRDYFTVPSFVKRVCDFFHLLLVSIGYAFALPAGSADFTFRSFGDFYAAHLNVAQGCSTLEEIFQWFEDAEVQFRAVIDLVAERTRNKVYGNDLANNRLNIAAIPADADPIEKLRQLRATQEEIFADRRKYQVRSCIKLTGSVWTAETFPLLSSRRTPTAAGKAPAKKQKVAGASPSSAPLPPMPAPPRTALASTGPGLPPGDLVGSYRWLNGGKYLVISGTVWNVPALAKHLSVNFTAVCWPYHLARCKHANRMARCNKHGKSTAHSTANASSHDEAFSTPLDLADLAKEFGRAATQEETQGLCSMPKSKQQAAPAAAAPGKGQRGRAARGAARGRGQRGRGRGRGGSPHLPQLTYSGHEEDDAEDMEDPDNASRQGNGQPLLH